MAKQYALSAEQIKPLAEGYGACIASDRITVDGCKVRYCYRESPDNEVDSGWRFLAGDEDDAYMDEASNHGIYNVNTVANYDPDIIPLLDAPVDSAFERQSADEAFIRVDFDSPD